MKTKNIFFSSDSHFCHTNILKYDNRPFSTIKEHDETLIDNWNKVVDKNDDIYYLGDFCFGRPQYTEQIMQQLNGNKYFIWGNHDKYNVSVYKKYGIYLGMSAIIKIDGQEITLNHFAQRVWNRSHRGAWMCYGHSHDSLENVEWGKSMDVGVQTAYRLFGKYRPIEFNEIKTILDKREVKIIDQHR